MRKGLIWLITAIFISACSGDGPPNLAYAAPDEVVDALGQPEWGPLEDWDNQLEPIDVLTGGAGVIVHYRTESEPENFFRGMFHGGDGWKPIDIEDHFVIDDERDARPTLFVGPRSIVIAYDGKIVESADGVEWVGPLDIFDRRSELTIFQDGDNLVASMLGQRTILEEWRSNEIGAWEQTDLSFFEPLEQHTAVLRTERHIVTGNIVTQYFGNEGQRLLNLTRSSDRFQGPLLSTFDGEQWQTGEPFALPNGTTAVSNMMGVWWSEETARWIAIGARNNEMFVSESPDGIAWQMRQDVVTPPLDDDDRFIPRVANGRVTFFKDRNSLLSTTDFVTWERFSYREDQGTYLHEIGNGVCLGVRWWLIGGEPPPNTLMSGPCPFNITEDQATLSPGVSPVGGQLAADPNSWDGRVEDAYNAVLDHDATLPVFGFLANAVCEGFVNSSTAGSVNNVSTEEVTAALGVATNSNCGTRLDPFGPDAVQVDADNWDEMIDERVGMIPHQRMTHQGFDAAAASECMNDSNIFEISTGDRYNNGETTQLAAVLEFDCDLLSSRARAQWDGTLLVAGRVDDDTEFDLFTLRADDGKIETTQLTTNPAYDHRGAFSPDGDEVIFTTETAGSFDVARVSADGGPVTKLTSEDAYDGRPSMSPDGTQIVFETEAEGRGGISIMDADGSDRRIIADGTVDSFSLGYQAYDSAWSPDGSKIAFYGGAGDDEMWIHDIVSGTNRSLTPEPEEGNDDFSWAPDSERIVFSGSDDRGFRDPGVGADLWVANTNSDEPPFRLLRLPGVQRDPVWSPDGKHIAFVTSSDRTNRTVEQIFVINLEDQQLTQLTSDPNGAEWPVWSPGSDALAYLRYVPDGEMGPGTTSTVAIVDLEGHVTLTDQRGVPLDWTN